jgi:hypothetical protein
VLADGATTAPPSDATMSRERRSCCDGNHGWRMRAALHQAHAERIGANRRPEMRKFQDDSALRALRSDEVTEVAGGFFAIRFPVGASQKMSVQDAANQALKGIGDGLASVARK